MQVWQIHITPVSGHSVRFTCKTHQIVAGISMIRQFNEFFNIIFGGFFLFGQNVQQATPAVRGCLCVRLSRTERLVADLLEIGVKFNLV